MKRSGWPITLLLALAALAGCVKRGGGPTSTQVLRVSQRNEPADLDPARATLPDEFRIIRALSEGLLSPDPAGGAPRPAVAESFDISADGLAYTFHLRDARWSNGEPVTAADFVESYHRLLTPATAAPKAPLFFAVKNARAFTTGALTDFSAVGFRAPDARTLVVTLEQPQPRFPHYVASGPWIPVNPHVVQKFGRAWTQPGHFVGNGPFTPTEWRSHQRLVVKKNPAFHNAAHVRLEEIQFIRFDDGDSEERAYRAGQLDVTMDVPRTKLAGYTRDSTGELHTHPLAETRYLSFNTQRPALADPRVRRALALAIDRDRLVARVVLGAQKPAARFLPPELRATPAEIPGAIRFDPAEARRLLADAGFPGGKNFPTVELTGWSPSQVTVLEAVQAMWQQDLGVSVTVAVRDAKVHFAALMSGGYDIGYMTAIPDVTDPADLLGRFMTGAPENFPHWSDVAFDRAVATGDFAAAESRLLEAAVAVPLYFNAHHWLMSARVRGWHEDAMWTSYYAGVWLER